MILHFSHIGLTDGRTFTLASLSSWEHLSGTFGGALETGAVAATSSRSTRNTLVVLQAHRGMVAGALKRLRPAIPGPPEATSGPLRRQTEASRPPDQAAARPPEASCQGVRIRGPSAVTAIVNSKCAAREPSWE
jgi:hypothetical protein